MPKGHMQSQYAKTKILEPSVEVEQKESWGNGQHHNKVMQQLEMPLKSGLVLEEFVASNRLWSPSTPRFSK